MAGKHPTSEHHAAAANHHGQAAHFHREAARHYQSGKDHAHAAHMALMAHGHASKAIWHGNEAQKRYEDFGVLAPTASISVQQSNVDIASHHTAAADDHEQAALHERNAAEHSRRNDGAEATSESDIAHEYARRAVFHGDEAAKHHVERYGKPAHRPE